MSKKTRILLFEKTSQFKVPLKALLKTQEEVLLIGETTSLRKALSLASETKPDVIMFDMNAAGANLGDICRSLRIARDKAKIVLMTARETEEEIFAALSSGADGYCLKSLNSKDLDKGLHALSQGDFWLDTNIGKKVIRTVEGKMTRFKAAEFSHSDDERLSQRELEVLSLIAAGMSNQVIADKLTISAETVKTHISHLMKKLAVRDRTHAAVKAVRKGLI